MQNSDVRTPRSHSIDGHTVGCSNGGHISRILPVHRMLAKSTDSFHDNLAEAELRYSTAIWLTV